MTLLGIISDTHGQLSTTLQARKLFEEQGVSVVIHCGDIGGEEIVRAFEGIETHFVYGNSDGENELLRQAAEETGNTFHGWYGSLERDGIRVFFLHGHQSERFEAELCSECWNLICVGHTHFPTLQQFGETVLLNPGALYRVPVPRVAVVRLPELEVESFTLDDCYCPGNLFSSI